MSGRRLPPSSPTLAPSGGDQAGVSPDQLRGALGDEHVQAIAGQLGLSPDALTQQLSQHLPALAQAHAADSGTQRTPSSAR